MKIGIPREIKVLEGRVALTPAAIRELVKQGHHVFIKKNAGLLSGYLDKEYSDAGATLLNTAKAVYDSAELIVKVKEPQKSELKYLRKDHILFSFLHLAAEPDLTKELLDIGLTAVAFETVAINRQLPLLAPMSDIAGRIAIQVGAHLLHQPQGGRGILLGGVTGTETEKGNIVILGGGIAGSGATQIASALGANVLVFDPNRDKQVKLEAMGQNVTAKQPLEKDIEQAVKDADLLIGAVLIPGAKTPHLVSAEQVKSMKAGSVIIDISVDQGGCIETTRPTTYEAPTFVWEDVIHFGVTNMPGAVPRTSTQALSAVLLPYVLQLCEPDWQSNPALASGINLQNGEIILPTLM
jgi:alanine dehydrogenase